MKRTTTAHKLKVDAILTADWHLREDTPICRTDDFEAAQWRKVDFISALQQEYSCPVLHAGDLYDHWKPSPALLSKTIEHLPKDFQTIYGNHDLPQHNIELAYKCGINVLQAAELLTVWYGIHWGQINWGEEVECYFGTHADRKVIMWHVMTYEGKPPWPGCTDIPANEILNQHVADYDLIITGHNHKTFHVEKDDSRLVNPGSLTRQAADQIEHIPTVFLWNAKTNGITPIELPYEKGVISREHIEKVAERDTRIQAFVERLSTEFGICLNFKDNLEQFESNNRIRPAVMGIVRKAIGE